MIFLFANMPSSKKIHQWRIEKCQRLLLEFQYYIIKTNSLRKVFISIKGLYYQAEIFGELVTWIVPFKYTQKVSKNVDYKVMLSFLEFYEVLLSFINFKLYHSLGLTYPPIFDPIKLANGEYLSALNSITLTDSNANGQPNIVEDVKKSIDTELDKTKKFELKKKSKERIKSLSKALVGVDEQSSEEDKEVIDTESVQEPQNEENETLDDFGDEQTKKLLLDQKVYTGLFKGLVFWISREVPRDSLEFVIKSFGGKVSWDGEGSVIENEEDESITHHIVDRGTIPTNKIISRDYVQPQYVYDCVNAKVLLPVDKYIPGVKLPPHLSPFVDYEKELYVPDYKKELDFYYKKSIGEKVESFLPSENTENVPEVEEFSEEELDEERYERELKAEKEGTLTEKPTKTNKAKKRKRDESLLENEEKEQAKTSISLLPRKQRRLLQRIEYGQKTKKGEVDKKELKKQKLKSKEALINNGIIQYTTNKDE
jgi:pescadillo protein